MELLSARAVVSQSAHLKKDDPSEVPLYREDRSDDGRTDRHAQREVHQECTCDKQRRGESTNGVFSQRIDRVGVRPSVR